MSKDIAVAKLQQAAEILTIQMDRLSGGAEYEMKLKLHEARALIQEAALELERRSRPPMTQVRLRVPAGTRPGSHFVAAGRSFLIEDGIITVDPEYVGALLEIACTKVDE